MSDSSYQNILNLSNSTPLPRLQKSSLFLTFSKPTMKLFNSNIFKQSSNRRINNGKISRKAIIYKERISSKQTRQTCQNLSRMNLNITKNASKQTLKKSKGRKMRQEYLPKKSIISSKISFMKLSTSKCINPIKFTLLFQTTNKKSLIWSKNTQLKLKNYLKIHFH